MNTVKLQSFINIDEEWSKLGSELYHSYLMKNENHRKVYLILWPVTLAFLSCYDLPIFSMTQTNKMRQTKENYAHLFKSFIFNASLGFPQRNLEIFRWKNI